MENQIHAPTPLEPGHRRFHALRHIVGAAGVSLALMNSGPATATAEASHAGSDASTPDYEMPKPSSLRGYNNPLNPETRKEGREATVEIRMRYAGSDEGQAWYKSCTGVKTTVNGKARISTAAHCFENLTGESFGLLKAKPGQPNALNYIEKTKGMVEYAVFDPQVDPSERKHKPLMKVDGIAIATGNDAALLSVVPLEKPSEGMPRTFDQIPAIKLADTQATATPRPQRGQRVSLYGVFSANGEKQSTSLGRYLGRIKDYNEDGTVRYVDVVGMKPKTIAEDTCLPGSSGSSFTATSKTGSTYLSGPMSGNINETWGPALFNGRVYDKDPNSVANEIEGAKFWRQKLTSLLNVNTSSFTTICTFSANLPNLVKIMESGFNTMAPIPERPGADAVGFEGGKGGDDSGSMK